jgi:hypothetical protein
MTEVLKISAYTDNFSKVRWRATDDDGEVLARSPLGYSTLNEMLVDLHLIMYNRCKAAIFQDSKEEWRWNISVPIAHQDESRIAAVSVRGYSNESECIAASKLFAEVDRV